MPLLRSALRRAQSFVPPVSEGFTVLAYHLVDGGTESPVDVSASAFEQQISMIQRLRRQRSLDDAVASLSKRERAGGAVVTFDDAFRNFSEAALPVLERHGVPAVLYVPVGFIDGVSPSPLEGAAHLPPLSWDELRELARHPLVTIGSHSCGHESAVGLAPDALRDDLVAARQRLERELGVTVPHYCYPKALWNLRTKRIVAGVYETATVAGGRVNTSMGFDPMRIFRTPVRRGIENFPAMLDTRVWLEEAVADQIRRTRAQISAR